MTSLLHFYYHIIKTGFPVAVFLIYNVFSLYFTPAVGCVLVGISLCNQTFVNSATLLVSLMACAHAR